MTQPQKIVGFLDEVTSERIIGWAMSPTKRPIKVKVCLNGKELLTVKAEAYRRDLVEANMHPTGKCGFDINLSQAGMLLPSHGMIQAFAGREQVELFNSPWFFYTEAYLNDVRHEIGQISFTEEAKKVLIIGLPKSGTSILTYRITAVLDQAVLHFEPFQALGLNHVNFHRQITRHPQVVTKSLYYPQYPNQLSLIAPFYNKRICIIRDPRDLLISTFFYSWNQTDNPPEERFETVLEQVEAKEHDPNGVSFYRLLETRPDVKKRVLDSLEKLAEVTQELDQGWFILKYEDFVENKVAQLNQYLGLEIDTAVSVPTALNRVERSKKHGNWRRWFNSEDVALFKPELTPYLAKFGYETAFWDLEETTSLPAAEGSQYIKKIFGYPRRRKYGRIQKWWQSLNLS